MSLKKFALLLLVPSMVLAACTALETDETTIWYVDTTGDDDNSCTEASSPCLTIAEAYGRANDDDQIIIAAGTYNEIARFEGDYIFSHIGFDLLVTGAGQGETIIDLGNMYGGFYVDGAGHLLLTDLTVQNSGGYIAGGCVNLINIGIAELKNVALTGCLTSGIANGRTSRIDLINVTIAESRGVPGYYGGGNGILNRGIAIIQGGEISGNAANGVYNSSALEMDGTLIQGNSSLGISNSGEATLSDMTIQNNGGLSGIKLVDGSSLSLTDSLVSANDGFGIEMRGETTRAIIHDTTISDHRFAGVWIEAGVLTLDGATIQNNGIEIYAGLQVDGGLVEVRNSHITQNHYGGIYNRPEGEVNLFETVMDENEGDSYGAFFNEGTANISTSLIANNIGEAAAAIDNRGDMTITNSTVSGNDQVGIIASGNLSLNYVTITGNEQGISLPGLSVDPANILFTNILVVKNIGGECNTTNPDIPDPRLAGVNIATSPGCAFPMTVSDEEIMLAELADNGGPTMTHALLVGSPAIDAASNTCPTSDQRLIPRPFGPACDVGAYETGAVTPLSLEATATPDSEIIVTVIQDARCRVGPDFIYPDYDFFEPGQTTTVLGRSADSNWYYVQALSFSGKCFIGRAVLQFDVEPEILLALPVIQPPPTPTPTLDPDESYDVTETPEPPKPTACPTLINKPGSCK